MASGFVTRPTKRAAAPRSTKQIEWLRFIWRLRNLDGVDEWNDFTIFASNFGKVATGWDIGDFDYHGGRVNGPISTLFGDQLWKTAATGTAVICRRQILRRA